jgi:hypothetical protein
MAILENFTVTDPLTSAEVAARYHASALQDAAFILRIMPDRDVPRPTPEDEQSVALDVIRTTRLPDSFIINGTDANTGQSITVYTYADPEKPVTASIMNAESQEVA